MNKILIIICFLSLSIIIKGQTENSSKQGSLLVSNKYLIKINPNVTYNVPATSVFIKQVCAAHTVTFNSSSGYFEVLTKRTLEQNIIDGKLQKNLTPMSDFIFTGVVKDLNNSATTNTLSTQ